MQDPQPDFAPMPGIAQELAPGLRRILAPNPSAMTFRGTNTYLVGERAVAVIDPGPDLPEHLGAILAALGPGQHVSHIFVSHAHLDHSPLAARLSQAAGAPVLAYGDARAGRSAAMEKLSRSGLVGGGEGVDHAFAPDRLLVDGQVVEGDGWCLEALYTPGHFGNHMAFAWNDTLFCGDLVMGWATSLVSPPDGDLTAFMSSLERLRSRNWRILHPGHGAPVSRPRARITELLLHREKRGAQILRALTERPATASELATAIYTETPPALLPAASRNVLAHLLDLHARGAVRCVEQLGENARFTVT
ncbi:MBL fold hydrolase [Salipiger pallidus]|uniref:MBL fold hydrolase n=1 Tax=Salipiger pallidus TaxID=1775170 RepID=A0A8J3EFI7_9RHOB|nr:MBL fold metallo-hydrolase [Salipiger pallidus]GGG60133.1 MBL fold hydrolase [Salipiger pallidus]